MSKGADTVSKGVIADVIIEGIEEVSGAQTVAPDTQGRGGPGAGDSGHAQYVPQSALNDQQLQSQVQNFLFRQAALLDAKDWQAYIDCFSADGVYWMPVEQGQTNWETEPSIFAEDVLMMQVRMGRMLHPNAWSQAPMWGTNHLVGNVVVESADKDTVEVYSRFQMMELRRDDVRHFGGSYRHRLVRDGDNFKIRLQRVDMMNGQAMYDYVLQAWV